MGRRRVGDLKARVGRESCVGRGNQIDQDEHWKYTSLGSPKRNTVLIDVRTPEEAGIYKWGKPQE